MKYVGSHCATHPRGTDIIQERQTSWREKAMKGEDGGGGEVE